MVTNVLVVGQTGAGKSSIVNILFNGDAELVSLSTPAQIGDGNRLCTSTVGTYVRNSWSFIQDTISFSDFEKESPEKVMGDIRSLFYQIKSRFTHIIFVIPFGNLVKVSGETVWEKFLFKSHHCDDTL